MLLRSLRIRPTPVYLDLSQDMRRSLRGQKAGPSAKKPAVLARLPTECKPQACMQIEHGTSLLALARRARLKKLRRKRMCSCFVARDGRSGEPIGCALASFMTPEAVLPFPRPSV